MAGTIEQTAVQGGDEVILVVEDEADVRATAVATLSRLGYTLLEAHDGDEALQVINTQQHIDMLFTDVVMPGRIRSPELARLAKAASLSGKHTSQLVWAHLM